MPLTPEQQLAKARLEAQGVDTSKISPTSQVVNGGTLTSANVGGQQYQTYSQGTGANTNFQNQDLASRQAILKQSNNSANTAQTTNQPSVQDDFASKTLAERQAILYQNNTAPQGATGNQGNANILPYYGPTNGAAPGSASSILGNQTMSEADIEAQRQADEAYAAANQVIDPNAIYEEKKRQSQAQIDALNAVYADTLNQARIQGQGRLGSNSAIQARRGLIGSNVGEAMTANQENANQRDIDEINRQKSLELQQLYYGIRQSADAEEAAKKKARKEGGDAYLEFLRGKDTRKKQLVQDTAQKLIALGKNPGDLTDADFAQFKIDKNDLAAAYNVLDEAQAEERFKQQQAQEKAALEALKTQSEIDKNQADIINEALKTGRVYEQGGFIFDGATNLPIGSAQAVKKASGGGSSGTGTGTYTINGQTYNSQLYAGLKSPTATAVRGQVGAFKSEPTVTNFNQIQEGYLLTQSLDNKTKNPTDDQALIYALAKTLDPGSVVREGEYATVQKYAQSWVDAYGKGVTQAVNGTGFLSEQARKNIKSTIESKYKTSKKTYDNLSNQYVQGINDLTGRQDGDKFIRDYSVQQSNDTVQNTGGATGNSNNPLGI